MGAISAARASSLGGSLVRARRREGEREMRQGEQKQAKCHEDTGGTWTDGSTTVVYCSAAAPSSNVMASVRF